MNTNDSITPTPTKNKDTTKNSQRGGTVRFRKGKFDVRLSLGSLKRKTFQLPFCKTEKEAEERRELMANLSAKLIASGRIEMGFPLIKKAAVLEGKALSDVVRAVDLIANGEVVVRKQPTGEATFRDVATQWLNGDLSKKYKDQIKPLKHPAQVVSLLERLVFPIVGALPMAHFTFEYANEVMQRLPEYEPGTRRWVAVTISRVVKLSVFLGHLANNPLPKGFIPSPGPRKAMVYLYPDEEAKLLSTPSIPLCDRVLYGFLAREGLRVSEALAAEWSDIDLERGAIVLDMNKTNDPRAWALSSDVARALKVWRVLTAQQNDKASKQGRPSKKTHNPDAAFRYRGAIARRLREDLKKAGITRAQLFETNENRRKMRAHDLRATFVTIGLATGRTETWIMDRTGHRSSGMVNNYRRAARTASELGLGALRPMDEAIPEIATALQHLHTNQVDTARELVRSDAATSEAIPVLADGVEGTMVAVSEARIASSTATNEREPNFGSASERIQQSAGASPASDVSLARASWSVPGPSAPETLPVVTSESKRADKRHPSRPLKTESNSLW